MSNHSTDMYVLRKTMTLIGQGQVTAIPDTAVVRLGVQTTGSNLMVTQSENAQRSQSVLQALQQIGVSDIKTVQYTINKLYDYENGKQIDRGYDVRNIFEIRTMNIEQVGNIIDTAVNHGANIIDLISFEISNPDYHYQRALNLALNNAIQKSMSISLNLGVEKNPLPIKITENSTMSLPSQNLQREFASTPIVPGNIRIDAMVTVDFLY